MKTILVTGAAGFIGSNAVEELLSRGYRVIGIDDFSTGKKENIKHLLGRFTFRKGSITNLRFLRNAVKNVDYILHFAALPSVPYSVEHPVETHKVNVDGLLNLLVSARNAGIKKLVFASSAAVYGDTETLPVLEYADLKPLSPYAAHKIIGEYYCRLFNDSYGLRTTSLRYFNVFGPRQNPKSAYAAVIPKFASLMKKGLRPIIYGDGKQTRDFVHVKDVINANILALKSKSSDGKVYNIASGKKTSISQLFRSMRSILKFGMEPIFDKPRAGDIKHSYADVSLAAQDLGFKPSISMRQGLKELLR